MVFIITLLLQPSMGGVAVGQESSGVGDPFISGDFVYNQNSKVTLLGNMNLLPHTIEAWVQPKLRTDQNSRGYNYGVHYPPNTISNDNPAYGGHGFGLNVWPDGSELVVGMHGKWRVVPNVNFTANQWYYIAVVYTTGNVKTYVNGSMVDDYSCDQKKLDGVNYIRIGKHNDDSYWGTRRFFNGSISDVTFWSVARSGSEIVQDMNNNNPGGPGFVSCWYGKQRPTEIPEIRVVIDGKNQIYPQPPVIVNERVLVPLRGIFESLGATVNWESSTQPVTAIKGSTTISLTVGSTVAYKNGVPIILDVPAQIVNERTMVPVRFVSEALGCQVDWIDSKRTVSISSPQRLVGIDTHIPSESGEIVKSLPFTPEDFELIAGTSNTANRTSECGGLLKGIVGKVFTGVSLVGTVVDSLNLNEINSIIADYPPSKNTINYTVEYLKRQTFLIDKPESWDPRFDTYGCNGYQQYYTETRMRKTLTVVNKDTNTVIRHSVDEGVWKPFQDPLKAQKIGAGMETLKLYETFSTAWGTITTYNP